MFRDSNDEWSENNSHINSGIRSTFHPLGHWFLIPSTAVPKSRPRWFSQFRAGLSSHGSLICNFREGKAWLKFIGFTHQEAPKRLVDSKNNHWRFPINLIASLRILAIGKTFFGNKPQSIVKKEVESDHRERGKCPSVGLVKILPVAARFNTSFISGKSMAIPSFRV